MRVSFRAMLSHAEIEAAAVRLAPHVRRTPVMHLPASELGMPVTLKLEFMQHSGSFKARGAFNRLLTAEPQTTGVAAASGGNHGAAVAYAAQQLGQQATIFVPAATPRAKVDRIRSYGATVVQGGDGYADALAACQAHQGASGAMGIHAYDDAEVLAGQGTVAVEFRADAPDLTHVLIAVGGGGLIGGVAGWYAGTDTAVIAVEPANCPTLHVALTAGRPVPVEVGGLAADSLGARQCGGLMFKVAQANGVQSILVSDDAIRHAQSWLWDRLRIVSEPGGATALAAILSEAWQPPPGARVGVLLCGANTDAVTISF